MTKNHQNCKKTPYFRSFGEVFGKAEILGPSKKQHQKIQSKTIPWTSSHAQPSPEVWSPQAKTAPSLRNAANARGADWICKMSSLNKKGCGFFPRLAKASLYFFLLGGGGENPQENRWIWRALHKYILFWCDVSSSNKDEEVEDPNLICTCFLASWITCWLWFTKKIDVEVKDQMLEVSWNSDGLFGDMCFLATCLKMLKMLKMCFFKNDNSNSIW